MTSSTSNNSSEATGGSAECIYLPGSIFIKAHCVLSLLLNLSVFIFILTKPTLRQSIRCQYFANQLILHVLMISIDYSYITSNSLGLLYCKDSIFIALCITKNIDLVNCYYDLKEPRRLSTTKDVITVVAIIVWPFALLVMSSSLLTQFQWSTWILVYISITIAGQSGIILANICLQIIEQSNRIDSVSTPEITHARYYKNTTLCQISSRIFLILSLPYLINVLLLLSNMIPDNKEILFLTNHLTGFITITEVLLFLYFSSDIQREVVKMKRFLNSEQRMLDRKKRRHFLTRERFSGSIWRKIYRKVKKVPVRYWIS